jgi:hypothetical protein
MLNYPKTRAALKDYFRRGSIPTEQQFADLIDSSVNRRDDGFALAPGYGLQLTASGVHYRMASFYPSQQQLDAQRPAWMVELAAGPDLSSGLSFAQAPALPDPATDDALATANGAVLPGTSRLYLQTNGNVGVGTTAPTDRLDVRGFVASQGRRGTYGNVQQAAVGVPADGEWHDILSGLNGLHAFEIVAAAYGQPKSGRYALTHATVLSAFGKSNSRIYRKNAWFWGWFQKIQFRWVGEVHNYGLQMRTASSFGAGARIVYHITCLFDNRRPVPPPPSGR